MQVPPSVRDPELWYAQREITSKDAELCPVATSWS
jgi:hypothetical protein